MQTAVRALVKAPVVEQVLATDWGKALPTQGFFRTWQMDDMDTVLQGVLAFADLNGHLMWVCFASTAALAVVDMGAEPPEIRR